MFTIIAGLLFLIVIIWKLCSKYYYYIITRPIKSNFLCNLQEIFIFIHLYISGQTQFLKNMCNLDCNICGFIESNYYMNCCNLNICGICYYKYICRELAKPFYVRNSYSTYKIKCINCYNMINISNLISETEFNLSKIYQVTGLNNNAYWKLLYCSKLNCPGKIINFVCNTCTNKICKYCLNDAHDDNCDPVAINNISEILRIGGTEHKNCPNCGNLIFKNGGCDDMRCWECGTDFYWPNLDIIKLHHTNFYQEEKKYIIKCAKQKQKQINIQLQIQTQKEKETQRKQEIQRKKQMQKKADRKKEIQKEKEIQLKIKKELKELKQENNNKNNNNKIKFNTLKNKFSPLVIEKS